METPNSIVIVGSGAFGLSTAWALSRSARYHDTAITVVDRQPFPAPDGSSIDTSRIIRSDYATPHYARLAARASARWRSDFATQHYHEVGLAMTASGPEQTYVSSSLTNVRAIGEDRTEVLPSASHIQQACGLRGKDEWGSGSTGYVNWNSGWANATAAMIWLRQEVEKLGRVRFVTARAKRLILDRHADRVAGIELSDGSQIKADLTVLAAGAWTGALVDLRGICRATGQVLCYVRLSPHEERPLAHQPILLNLSHGLFLIPPEDGVLKVARHGHGYLNPTTIAHPESDDGHHHHHTITTSLPYTSFDDASLAVPDEGQRQCRAFLAAVHPSLGSHPFERTALCWYADTANGDFLISYHPKHKGLFLATGGSGHGFKFLPVIGDSVLECIEGRTPDDFKGKWDWPSERVPEEQWKGDGSRGGPVGLSLPRELAASKTGMKASVPSSRL